MNRCPVCADASCRSHLDREQRVVFECPRCGSFTMTVAFAAKLPALVDGGTIDRSALSHYIRLAQPSDNTPAVLLEGEIGTLAQQLRPLTPGEQRDRLILWLGDNQSTPGQFVQSRKKPLSAVVGCHVTALAAAEPELDWLVNQMKPLGYFDTHFSNQPTIVALRLTLRGWELYGELDRSRLSSRQALVAIAPGDPAVARLVEECFRPVAAQAGFELAAPSGLRAGGGEDGLRQAIRASAFLVADLTDDSPGVLYAAGFAEGVGRPVFYTCEHTRGPADAAALRWQADDLAGAGRELAALIGTAFPAHQAAR
jgi:hypothetical protein